MNSSLPSQAQATPRARIVTLTALSMMAFAGNSLLCRLALHYTTIDAASFTSVRLACGALALYVAARMSGQCRADNGSWASAIALFVYAATFSYAYSSLTAATGALLLFGAVQTSMIGYGVCKGERLRLQQIAGVTIACAGLAGLLLPGLAAPSVTGSALMLCAGTAWGAYSLRGKTAGSAVCVTAGNFARAVPLAVIWSAITIPHATVDLAGLAYAAASGILASGVGYVIWYTALPALRATTAATVQLSVPVIAAIGGIVFLGESVSLRLAIASVAILGGIALVILTRKAAH
jgi:drug/metabolite transporter (DMT)-like permease